MSEVLDISEIVPVKGMESHYGVTRDGRVYSYAKTDARGNRRKGKWLKPIPDEDGYLRIHTCINSVRRKIFIHRLMAETFLENTENKPLVNHKDGVKTNLLLTNLEWATSAENTQHAIRTGLMPRLEINSLGQFVGAKNGSYRNP